MKLVPLIREQDFQDVTVLIRPAGFKSHLQSSVTLGKLLSQSEPQFAQEKDGSTYPVGYYKAQGTVYTVVVPLGTQPMPQHSQLCLL